MIDINMRIGISAIILFIMIGCDSTPKSLKLDCSKLRDGVFLTEIDTPYYKGEITRKGNTQIEKNLETGATATLEVKWIDDCTYMLTPVSETDSSLNYLKNKSLTVEITKVAGDTVYTLSYIPGINFKPEIKMIKIR